MTLKPNIWYPIATVLAVLNVAAIAFAIGPESPWHAMGHGALATVAGVWAYHLRLRLKSGAGQNQIGMPEAVDALEGDVDGLRRELAEMQERLDFAERMLAQGAEQRRKDPLP